MRPNVVFCAITLGMGCDASATELGLASFYGSGGLTAAHRSLPLGSQVRVLNLDNGRSVVVRIVDRGPFIRGRIIDVSTAAALTLGFQEAGLAHVQIYPISPETREAKPRQQAATALPETSPDSICRYGAERLENLQSASVRNAALSRNALGCESWRYQLFAFAQKSKDLAPLAARGGAFLTETEAAASIPVSVLIEVPEHDDNLRTQLSQLAQRSERLNPPASGGAVLTETEAAASIPVSALAEVSEREASMRRAAGGCNATRSCEETKRRSPSNPVLFLFAALRQIFN